MGTHHRFSKQSFSSLQVCVYVYVFAPSEYTNQQKNLISVFGYLSFFRAYNAKVNMYDIRILTISVMTNMYHIIYTYRIVRFDLIERKLFFMNSLQGRLLRSIAVRL